MRCNMFKFYNADTETLYVCTTSAAMLAFLTTAEGLNSEVVVEQNDEPSSGTLNKLRRSHAGTVNPQSFFCTHTRKIISPGINYDLEHSSNSDLKEVKLIKFHS